MGKTGRICGVCGDIGQIEKLAVCSLCGTACRHMHCAQAPAPSNQLGSWYCQTCRKQQTKMPEKKTLDKVGVTRRFENSKVKFLSSEEVISMSCGTVRQCIKTTTTSSASSIQTAPPSGSPTQTTITKSVSGSKDMGHKLSSLKGQLPCCPAPIAWKGSLEVHQMVGKTLVELVAYIPLQVSAKLYSAIVTLPAKLQMKMVPHYNAWPKQLKTDLPNLEDIGVYLLPSERGSRLKCSNLLRQVDSNKCALKMNINACLELVVYSSQILPENSQRIEGDFFFWGFFWKRKMSSCSKKKIINSPDKIPSRTNPELGASPDCKTPIAIDKRAAILKHNPVGNEVIADISDICENKSLEEVVADTLDVPRGFTKPPIGQEINPMDRQSETSMRGKETQPLDKGVAPGCSTTFDLANEGIGLRRFFSSIGVGLLEAALGRCEDQKKCPEASVLTVTNSKQTAEEAERKRVPKLPNASLETAPDQGSSEREPDIVSWQNDTPGFGSSSQILIKQEKEPLIPLPVGLKILPGFPRRVETREQKNISNQQLDTLPGFGTSGRVFIKHEKDPLIPLPVGLEVPPGFSRRVEARVERNISNEFSSRSLPMNQGIVHQGTPVGQNTVVFSDLVFQGTLSESCSTQPTSLRGIHGYASVSLFQGTSQQRSIPEVSPNQSLTIQEADLTEVYPEMCQKETPKNSENYQDVSPVHMVVQNQNDNHCMFMEPDNANVSAQTRAPPHFRVLNPWGPRDRYCPPSNKETADFADMAKGEGSHQREIGCPSRWSQITPRNLYMSRPRSPALRQQSRSRSPVPRWKRSRSRSPVPRRKRRRSRSPVLRRKRRSRSPVPRQHGSRSRQRRSRSRSYQR